MKREHALTQDGVPRYILHFSKLTFVVKLIKTAPEKIYIKELISEVKNTEQDFCEPKLHDLPERYANKPEKEEAIKKKVI